MSQPGLQPTAARAIMRPPRLKPRVRRTSCNQMKRTVVAIIGGFTHEGVKTSVDAIGCELMSLGLDRVSLKTWHARAAVLRTLREADELAATVIYLHTALLLKASSDGYRDAFLEILEQGRLPRLIVFAFQENLDGIFSIRHWETRELMTRSDLVAAARTTESDYTRTWLERAIARLDDYEARKPEIDALIRAIYASGASVAPFFKRSEVTTRLQEFLSEADQGVFLRLFVRHERIQAEQIRGLLDVLQRYLRQVEGMELSIDTHRSEQGVVYAFRSAKGQVEFDQLQEALQRFDTFMRVCNDTPSQAATILARRGMSHDEALRLVDRYARDYRRLLLDTRHEFEQKTLLLRQRLETEALDVGGRDLAALCEGGLAGLLAVGSTGARVEVNIGSVSVVKEQEIRTAIEQLVIGNVVYNEEDRELFGLFERYADRLEALSCRADLDQLKDKSVPEPTRRNAKQRLLGFLRKAAAKATDVAENVAVGTLTKYLESLAKGI